MDRPVTDAASGGTRCSSRHFCQPIPSPLQRRKGVTVSSSTQLELAIIPHAYEGELICQRRSDGYINATAMCRAAGREWSRYRELKSTKEFFAELSLDLVLNEGQLTATILGTPGGDARNQGTWVHPQVAIHLAQWLSAKFAVQVSKWVFEWMSNGGPKVDLAWQQFHDRIGLNYDSVPEGYFSVFKECASLYATMLSAGAKPGTKMILDISIGQHWSRYWKDNKLDRHFGRAVKYSHDYPIYFPQSASNPQEAWAYPDAALPTFRRWLRQVYASQKMPAYLDGQVRQGRLTADIVVTAMVALEDHSTKTPRPLR